MNSPTSQSHEHFLVASDGSVASDNALHQCYYEFFGKNDKITVLSVTDRTKTHLPTAQQPSTISDKYNTFMLSHLPKYKYSVWMKDKEGSIKDTILSGVQSQKASWLFIGYHGKKGDNKDDATVMGSTLQNSAYQSSTPICIIKDYIPRKQTKSKGYTFLVCLDGSEKAFKALDLIKILATHSEDKIIGVTITSNETSHKLKHIKEVFQDFLENNELKGEYRSTQIKQGENIADKVVEYLKSEINELPDYLVFGTHSARKQEVDNKQIGSIAEALISNIRCNQIMIP